jgi:hypothetical protein
VTVSIGVAALDAGSSRELTELLAAADAALYRAKASGRDQVQMISTSRGLSAVRPPAENEGSAAGKAFSSGSGSGGSGSGSFGSPNFVSANSRSAGSDSKDSDSVEAGPGDSGLVSPAPRGIGSMAAPLQ